MIWDEQVSERSQQISAYSEGYGQRGALVCQVAADQNTQQDDANLFERLCAQMWDECTFIVRKEGKFGILFEVEFCSQESEEHAKAEDPDWYATLKPHAEVVNALLEGMQPLAERYSGVQFAVPDKSQVINDRPAAWAFVSDGLLSAEQREELGKALLDL